MKRASAMLALVSGLLLVGPASGQGREHDHSGFLFQIRFTPELNEEVVYRAFLLDPADPASLLVERGDGWLGDEARVDLDPASCPALRRAVESVSELPLPAIHLGEPSRYESGAPRAAEYQFTGFVRFPNGGGGEVGFYTYDVPGRPGDPQLEWARGLVRAFEACRRTTGSP